MEKTPQNKSFALYRLPRSSEYKLVMEGGLAPLVLEEIKQLDEVEGFVISPFRPSAQEPIVVIQGKAEAYIPGESLLPECCYGTESPCTNEGKEAYEKDFTRFHQALSEERFGKLVLARRTMVEHDGSASAEELFLEASRRYPRMMIALVSTPYSGTWLMATPETLLTNEGTEWHTMALAGTMQLSAEELERFDQPVGSVGTTPQWSAKNQTEQRLVADYLMSRLKPFSTHITQEPPCTVRAGHLVHLRSNFTFSLSATDKLGTLLETLHPTPAVCGLPKEEAMRFILENETEPREYYSGFMGPLSMKGETHLYVSLRCMRIHEKYYVLHAGGGLLAESVMENEWRETVQKMETMNLCIAASRT